jgi:hypothetical protein
MKHKLGVIIPFRDRDEHLKKFIPYIHDFLKNQNIDFEIIVVDQRDRKPFNRGKLLNIGFELLKDKCDYFAFHDVDMLPLEADYSYVDKPTHLATKLSTDDYQLAFPAYFGGVTLFNKEDFETINGYSNEYWGWGFEDDDLLYRCINRGLLVDKKIFGNESRINYCLNFDGDGDYVEIPCNNKLQSLYDKNFTISLIGKPKNIILDEKNKKDYDEYFFIAKPGRDGGLSFTSFNRYKAELFESEDKSISITSEITGEHWVHLVFTRLGNKLYLYLNGELVGKKTIDSVWDYSNSSFYIGCANPDRNNPMFFKGDISSVGIWTDGFKESQVAELYNNDLPLTKKFSKSLELCYDFKNIVNDKIIDLSGNDNHGILNGARQVEYDSISKSSIYVPFRRHGKFTVLSHKNNSWNEMTWVNKETRKNQLKFFNEVRTDLFDMGLDGLNTLRYKKIWDEELNRYRKVVVT